MEWWLKGEGIGAGAVRGPFDVVAFHFPHVGGAEGLAASIAADTALLAAFLGVAAGVLGEMPGIEELRDHGHFQELRLAGNPQELLKRLCAAGEVNLFEIVRPSLHDIFVRIAGEETP